MSRMNGKKTHTHTDYRAGLRGYVQFNKYTHTHTHTQYIKYVCIVSIDQLGIDGNLACFVVSTEQGKYLFFSVLSPSFAPENLVSARQARLSSLRLNLVLTRVRGGVYFETYRCTRALYAVSLFYPENLCCESRRLNHQIDGLINDRWAMGTRHSRCYVVVIVVDSHIQHIVLATEETTVTRQVSHGPIKCQSRLWSQRGTKVNGSPRGDNPLLRPTGIQIATKSYATPQAMAPTNIKTVDRTSLLHIESSLDRLGLLSPTHDQRSHQ